MKAIAMKRKSSWRDRLPVHPAADWLPSMSDVELVDLADDIEKNGLHHKIDLHWDAETNTYSVIDGRNRLDALESKGYELFNADGELKSEYRSRTATDLGVKANIYDWVVSTNILRRHLTTTQREQLVNKMDEARRQAGRPVLPHRKVAKIVGLDHKTVAKAREVSGVKSGEIPQIFHLEETIKAHPNKSNRQIAKLAEVSPPTVAAKRTELESAGLITRTEKRIDAKGVEQPVRRTPGKRVSTATAIPAPEPPRLIVDNANGEHDVSARKILKQLAEDLRTLDLTLMKTPDPKLFCEMLRKEISKFADRVSTRKGVK